MLIDEEKNVVFTSEEEEMTFTSIMNTELQVAKIRNACDLVASEIAPCKIIRENTDENNINQLTEIVIANVKYVLKQPEYKDVLFEVYFIDGDVNQQSCLMVAFFKNPMYSQILDFLYTDQDDKDLKNIANLYLQLKIQNLSDNLIWSSIKQVLKNNKHVEEEQTHTNEEPEFEVINK